MPAPASTTTAATTITGLLIIGSPRRAWLDLAQWREKAAAALS